jgi:hypothetical protein
MNQITLREQLQIAMNWPWCLHPVYRIQWTRGFHGGLEHRAGTRNDRRFKRVATVAKEASNEAETGEHRSAA